MVEELFALYKSLDKFPSDELHTITIEFGETLLRYHLRGILMTKTNCTIHFQARGRVSSTPRRDYFHQFVIQNPDSACVSADMA
jgi:hypothetical protein